MGRLKNTYIRSYRLSFSEAMHIMKHPPADRRAVTCRIVYGQNLDDFQYPGQRNLAKRHCDRLIMEARKLVRSHLDSQ